MVQIITRECGKCKQVKRIDQFKWRKGYGGDNYANCISCDGVFWNTLVTCRSEDPRLSLLERSKLNALTKGIEHTLSLEDIELPNTCKYLGVQLTYKSSSEPKEQRWANTLASIDRIDNTKGYVSGNIQVISYLANRMKQGATIKQLIDFAIGILEVHGT